MYLVRVQLIDERALISRLLGRPPSPLTSVFKGTSSANGSSPLVKELWVPRLEIEKLEGTERTLALRTQVLCPRGLTHLRLAVALKPCPMNTP